MPWQLIAHHDVEIRSLVIGALRKALSAATPSSASATLVQPISLSRPRTMRRMVEKSSTIRNFRSVGLLMSRASRKGRFGWGFRDRYRTGAGPA